MGRLENKIAIVTGGAQGLGAAIAAKFAAEGAQVAITDIQADKGRDLAATIPGCEFYEHDISDEGRWQSVIDAVEERFGGLHILVNNAGAVRIGNIEEQTVEDFRFHERVLLDGAFLGCKYALPSIVGSGGGSIVNITAMASVSGVGSLPGYSAAKAGIAGLTRSVAAHCRDNKYPVKVNAVAPGKFDTAMMRLGQETMGDDPVFTQAVHESIGRPSDFANFVAFLASDESVGLTGHELLIDNGERL